MVVICANGPVSSLFDWPVAGPLDGVWRRYMVVDVSVVMGRAFGESITSLSWGIIKLPFPCELLSPCNSQTVSSQ